MVVKILKVALGGLQMQMLSGLLIEKYKNYERQREGSKPNTQLGSSSATSASNSKGKDKTSNVV